MSVELTYRSIITLTDDQFKEIKNTVKTGDFIEGTNLPEHFKQRVYCNMSLSKMEWDRLESK
jgi:hypothetical protein